MKTNLLKFFIVIAFLLISTSATYAKWAVVCGYFRNEYHCAAVNRGCIGVTWVPLAEWTCKDLNILVTSTVSGTGNRFNENKLIREKDGKALFQINGELIPIASDAFEAKMEELAKLNARQLMGDEKLKKDFEAFLVADKGIVSDKRLQEISKDTGLPIGKFDDDANPKEQRMLGLGDPIPGKDVGLEHDPAGITMASLLTDANGGFSIKLKEGKYNLILPYAQLAKSVEGTDRKPPLKQTIHLFLTVQAESGRIFDRWGNLFKTMPKENITNQTGKINIIVPKGGGVLVGVLTSESIK